MDKVNSAIKRKLREDWEKVCNSYLLELLNMWGLGAHYGYWIGEEVGGVYDYDGAFTINMNDIIYCVENDVTEEEYIAWQDYVCAAHEFSFDTPNLRSWVMGCPRVSEATFEHLRHLKENLNDAIDEAKKKVRESDDVLFFDGKEYEWVNMETFENHCYDCALFRNNKCMNMDLCKNPKCTYIGFFKERS